MAPIFGVYCVAHGERLRDASDAEIGLSRPDVGAEPGRVEFVDRDGVDVYVVQDGSVVGGDLVNRDED
jgi:hypothetical protein